MSTIGERLRELRGTSTLREMADPVGIKFNAWARYEADGAIPGGDIIIRICRVHACSADWLLGLREHGTGAVTVKGNGNAVANGAHAIAISGSPVAQPGASALCRKCPHLKKLKSLEKAFAK